MMKYNHSLDYLMLAAKKLSQGKPLVAGALMTKAVAAADFHKGLEILEHSNAQAFAATAAAKTKPAAKSKPAVKAAAKGKKMTTAAHRLFAELEGEDPDVADLIGDVELDDSMPVEAADDESEDFMPDDADADEDDSAEDLDIEVDDQPVEARAGSIAAILASMGVAKKPTKKR